jgi:hypothetical protein
VHTPSRHPRRQGQEAPTPDRAGDDGDGEGDDDGSDWATVRSGSSGSSDAGSDCADLADAGDSDIEEPADQARRAPPGRDLCFVFFGDALLFIWGVHCVY